ncbi:Gpr1 family protein [Mycena kentingensis (nom. inval.)]|nr:Gpr1 family protein [Mycena kentingensis (nom. inval.)]
MTAPASPSDPDEPVAIVIGAIRLYDISTAAPGYWYDEASDTDRCGSVPNWVLQLDGRAITLYGVSPPDVPQCNQTIAVASPTNPRANMTSAKTYVPYTWPAPAFGGELYTTGRLPDPTTMELGLLGYRGVALHYALVEVGEFTNLTGQTILVDDTSTEIAWRGGWKSKAAGEYASLTKVNCQLPISTPSKPDNLTFTPFTATMFPHGNSTHATGTKGDEFEFHFAGTSINVYGVAPGAVNSQSWQLEMVFSLDGTTNTTQTYTASSNTDNYAGPGLLTNYLYFSATHLSAGNHTLVGTILDVAGTEGTMAHIDYLTYEPSFATMHEKPKFSVSSGSSNTTDSGGGGGTRQPASTNGGGGHSDPPVGGIVGGVLGGVVAIGLLIFGLVWNARRKRHRASEAATSNPNLGRLSSNFSAPIEFDNSSPSVYEPFIAQPSFSPPSGSASAKRCGPDTSANTSPEIPQIGDGDEQRANTASPVPSNTTQSAELDTRVRDLQREVDMLRRQMVPPPEYE